MVDEMNEKFSCKNFSKTLKKDCLEKLVQSEIIAVIGEDNTMVTNYKPFSQMNNNEIKTVLKSFDEICNYNKDFAQLRLEFLSYKYPIVNIVFFRNFIKTFHSGYYYKKALFFFILKVILIISGLLFNFLIDYPKNVCTYDRYDKEKDKAFWIFKEKKYKVKTVERDNEWYFRLMYFFLFDLIYIISELYFLINLQRRRVHKPSIIFYQILKYLCKAYIIALIFLKENYCEKSDNDENMFFIKTNILEKIFIIEDIIKFLIN